MGVLRKLKVLVGKREGLAMFPNQVVEEAQHADIEYTSPNLEPQAPKHNVTPGGVLAASGAIYFRDGRCIDKTAIPERQSTPPTVSKKRRGETLRDLVASKMRW